MARTTFTAEVLTPEGEVFNDEVEMVSPRTTVGSIGILANHQPLLGMLEPTELRLYKSETEVVRLAQGEGYVQVAEGRVLILVEEASDPASLDVSTLREKLQTAERELEQAEDGSEAARVAERERRRTEAFTGTPGTYVSIDDTVRSFREVIDGEHDDLPESAFFMKGGIDAVVEAANKG